MAMQLLLSFPLFALSTSSSKQQQQPCSRKFQFVPYGASAKQTQQIDAEHPASHPAIISCDGRIDGVTLELTHWNGNTTPQKYYADTSTEMALNLPSTAYPNAIVCNNHFDTDGVLSVWACLQPELAQRYRDELVQGAEAGDFGEWSSDLGIQLDAVLEAWCQQETSGEAAAFAAAFERLPELLRDLTQNQGASFKDGWKPVLDDARQSWEAIQSGQVTLERRAPGLVLTQNEPTNGWLSSFALHRALVERGWWESTNRILRTRPASASDSDHRRWDYRYEKPGHGWVNRLVQRRAIPAVAKGNDWLAQELNAAGPDSSNAWQKGGSSLVSICQATALAAPADQIVAQLQELEGASILS